MKCSYATINQNYYTYFSDETSIWDGKAYKLCNVLDMPIKSTYKSDEVFIQLLNSLPVELTCIYHVFKI